MLMSKAINRITASIDLPLVPFLSSNYWLKDLFIIDKQKEVIRINSLSLGSTGSTALLIYLYYLFIIIVSWVLICISSKGSKLLINGEQAVCHKVLSWISEWYLVYVKQTLIINKTL